MRSREPKHLKWKVSVGLKKEDIDRLRQERSNSTCRTLSEYCRKLLLGKPVRVFYRDQSFDAFIDEVIVLRKEMQNVLGKGPFSTEDERRLINLQEEIKKYINKIFDHVCQNRTGGRNSRNP